MTETPSTIETAQPAPVTPAAELKPTRHQLRIAKLQQTLHDRMSGKKPLKQEPRAVNFTSQLEKSAVDLLTRCKNEGALDMVEPLKVALQHLAGVVTKIESADQDRLRAATTIAWLAAQSLRAEIKLTNNEVKKAIAGKSAAAAAARKSKHDAAKVGSVLEIAKARKRIDRQLRRAAEEEARTTELARLELAVVDTRGDRFNHLLAKQALMSFKAKGKQ